MPDLYAFVDFNGPAETIDAGDDLEAALAAWTPDRGFMNLCEMTPAGYVPVSATHTFSIIDRWRESCTQTAGCPAKAHQRDCDGVST